MADLTFGELETLWIQAGGSKAVAPVMAAIALAESGGNPAAQNDKDNHGTQSSYGLWQISNGTHNPPSGNWQNPRVNAALAVAKYQASGLAPWGTYPQPALTILAQHGGQGPSSLPSTVQGGSGSGSGSGGGSSSGSSGPAGLAADTAAGGSFGLNPFSDIASVWDQLTRGIAGGVPIVSSVEQLGKDFNALVKLGATFMHDIEWLFVPSHWVRLFAGVFGVGTLITGVWALSRTGSGAGDVSLAMGIGLVTFAGILLFIAFHNLDSSVTNLSSLLGAFSKSVTSGESLSVETA